METIQLATPITPVSPTTSTYRVRSLMLDWDGARIVVVLSDNNGVQSSRQYEGAEATALMVALNKANLTTNSLHKRVLNQLASDGKLPAGSVTGTPD